ncbi:uncharacterized protein LOC120340027 isoform X2 [Styela clava]
MSKENLYENPSNRGSLEAETSATNTREDGIIDERDVEDQASSDESQSSDEDETDLDGSDKHENEKTSMRQEIQKLPKKKRQRMERELMFGKFTAEIGWKLILSITVYVFAMSALVGTFAVFIFVEGKDRKVPGPPAFPEPDPVIEKANEMYADLNKKIDAMQKRIKEKKERVISAINNQTKEIMKKMSGKRLVERVKHVSKNLAARMDEKEAKFKLKLLEHKTAIEQQAREHQQKTSATLAALDDSIMTSFTKQGMKIDEATRELTNELVNSTSEQGKLLGGKMEKVLDAVNKGINDMDANYTAQIGGFYGNIEGNMLGFLTDMRASIAGEALKVNQKVLAFKNTINSTTDRIEKSLGKRKSAQDKILQNSIDKAMHDVANVTTEIEANIKKTFPEKLKAIKKKILAKVLDVTGEMGDYKNQTVKALEDTDRELKKELATVMTPMANDYDTKWNAFKKDMTSALADFGTAVGSKFEEVNKNDLAQSCDETRYGNALTWDTNKEGAVYKLTLPAFLSGIEVYCSNHKGWLVLMRYEPNPDFFRDFTLELYQTDVGKPAEDNYWIGLDNMHKITSYGNYKLKIELTPKIGTVITQVYESFRVGDEASMYKLTIGKFDKTESNTLIGAGDFSQHDGAQFVATGGTCASTGGSGWWYYVGTKNGIQCFQVKLTGTAVYADIASRGANRDDIHAGMGMSATQSLQESNDVHQT